MKFLHVLDDDALDVESVDRLFLEFLFVILPYVTNQGKLEDEGQVAIAALEQFSAVVRFFDVGLQWSPT